MSRGVLCCFDDLGLKLGFSLVVVVFDMGCSGSKVDDLPLVIRCRERKELIRAAAEHRYALASAHVSYFRSLKDVGDALRQFVEEELTTASPPASPVLTLPSDEGKSKKKKTNADGKGSSSSTSMSHSASLSHNHSPEDDHDYDGEGSHLHLSSGSDSDLGSSPGHHRHYSSEFEEHYRSQPPQTAWGPYGMNSFPQTGPYGMDSFPQTGPYGMDSFPQTGPYGMNSFPQTVPYGMNSFPQTGWDPYGVNRNLYYMKKSAPAVQSVIYEEPRSSTVVAQQLPDSSYAYSNSFSGNENGGYFGFSMGSPRQPSPPAAPPQPPSPPRVSAWDFLNPFDAYDNGYPGFYSQSKYEYSVASSPNSDEVRQREGIPDLEDETENEAFKEVHKRKKLNEDTKKKSGEGSSSRAVPSQNYEGSSSRAVPSQNYEGSSSRAVPSQNYEGSSSRAVPSQNSEGSSSRAMPSHSSKGSTRAMPSQYSEGISRAVPSQNSEGAQSVGEKEEKSSPDTIVSKGSDDGSVRKKGVSFEVDEVSMHDVESPKLSSVTTLSAHSTRDLQEVVTEIRDEFEIASNYGKEVALMLEVGKLPYQPRFNLLKVLLSRILNLISPSLSSSQPPSRRSVRLAFKTMKLAKSYYGDSGKNGSVKRSNLSSTLEKLYVWEKKLYKEVKDEENIRIIYEKECRRLKVLDDQGAESSKIDASQASIRKLLTKLNVGIKAVDAISSRIHKLRDEELQPQVNELIHGLIRMWKSMLKCHQKQFQAIMESKTRHLRANTAFRRDSSLKATVELETELLTWYSHFNDWINSQKFFIESLNGWLLGCLFYEPEETPDGVVPFSPGRIGAPPIFVICNDWSQAMESISERGVANAVNKFASTLQQSWEREGEQRQMLKAEYVSKDFQRRLRTLRMERGRMEQHQNAVSGKAGASMVPSESGVSSRDDLKVDLDSIRKRMDEERARHNAAPSSLQAGLIPIFEAMGNFSAEALKAYEQVRIQNAAQGSGGK
ncbi:nitrate regulatory gene2 protein isoform X2 [Cornus florida]|nr:nitrate regulatory gene2 protein isoform X2 [Cornus florida]XP_059631798.1 nitrate regulatory gene2 protein isoform X2 [Cornus florida]